MTTPIVATIESRTTRYTWEFAFGPTQLLTNTVVWLACYNSKEQAFREYLVRAYTEQPIPHPEVFCTYRAELYDALGAVAAMVLKQPGIFVTHLSTEPGAVYVQS